jgi:glycerophosphoryl diester phosphodiesterase
MSKRSLPADAAHRPFDLQGHRGARGLWPENTLPGFRAAIALGVTSIELDVVLTKDSVPVVFHDLALNPHLVRGPDGQFVAAPGPAIASLTAAACVPAPARPSAFRPKPRWTARQSRHWPTFAPWPAV